MRRSAFFAERGLTGRDPRPYPPAASEWLDYSHLTAGAFLEQLAGSLDALPDDATDLALLLEDGAYRVQPIHCGPVVPFDALAPARSTRPSSGSQIGQCPQHHVDFSWSYSIAYLAWSSVQGQHFITRTTIGLALNKVRTNTKAACIEVSGSNSAFSRNPRWINTFTRRAPYRAPAEPISSRLPTTALFSVGTNWLPKVGLQLPIGDDVSRRQPGA